MHSTRGVLVEVLFHNRVASMDTVDNTLTYSTLIHGNDTRLVK